MKYLAGYIDCLFHPDVMLFIAGTLFGFGMGVLWAR